MLRKTRSVHVAIATILLAGPASALALTSASALPVGSPHTIAAPRNPLQIRIAPQRIAFGHPVLVAGRAPQGDAGRTAVLETELTRRSAWHQVAAARIGRAGEFRLQAVLSHSGYVRVVEEGVGAASGTPSTPFAQHAGAVPASAPHPVAVSAQLRVPSRSRDVLGGEVVTIAGRLLPAGAGRRVWLEGHFADGWRRLASARTGLAGGFHLRYVAASGLERHLRVVCGGDRANTSSVGPAGRLTVYQQSVASWYQDGGATGCGFHAGLGVANRSLPCGTKVRIRYGGRSVTAVVDDRGPFVGGRDWDLNQNTAGALGFGGVGTIWVTQ